MNAHTQVLSIAGPVGAIDISVDLPQNAPVRGLALVSHPHPLFAGTKDNKVAQTLARTFVALGYATVRPNFRGVGGTAGEHDKGIGEQDDQLAVIDWMRHQTAWSPDVATLPLALGGFSFGLEFIDCVEEVGKPRTQREVLARTSDIFNSVYLRCRALLDEGEEAQAMPLTSFMVDRPLADAGVRGGRP